MIEKLSIRNLKILREVDARLMPLTVIVGPNASGKSTVLRGLQWLAEFYSSSKGELPWLAALSRGKLVSSQAKGPTTIRCSGTYRGNEGDEFSLGVQIDPETEYLRGKETDQFPFRHTLSLTLDVKKLAAPSFPTATSLEMSHDGEGFSSLLAGLYLEDPYKFQEISMQLREVVPSVEAIKIKRTVIEKDRVGFALLFDMKGAKSIAADAVSDGTLITLGLLTALTTSPGPQLVLIDDLEHGLHPRALKELVSQIRGIQQGTLDLQIVATSHSPYLLDYLKAEEILLTSIDEDGYTVMRSLTDHPEYERWKDLMAPGEFWSSVGEDWITKEKKATAQ